MKSLFGIGLRYAAFLLKANGDPASDAALAGRCLKEKPGFRYPGSASADALLVFKSWLKALRATMSFSGAVYYTFNEGKEGTAVFDHKSSVRDIRVAHLKSNVGYAPRYTIARHDLRSGSFFRFFEFLALSAILLPWALLLGLKASRRTNAALLFQELLEAHALLEWLSKKQIKTLFFYSPFEVDANALYLLIKELDIEVYKIPSPNLLAIHNQMLLSDVLVLSSPYQADEMEAFKSTIRCRRVLHWRPEQFDAYGHLYTKEMPAARTGTLGYYSHASWVRHSGDEKNTGIGDHESELLLKQLLGAYLAYRQDLKVMIFLHPKEKRHPQFSEVVEHYNGVFGQGKYEFAPLATPGSQLFHTVDVGIGAISTILFERLFLGYKTLFFPAAMKDFPLPSSLIKIICPDSAQSLQVALDKALDMPAEQYFSQTGLLRYTKEKW